MLASGGADNTVRIWNAKPSAAAKAAAGKPGTRGAAAAAAEPAAAAGGSGAVAGEQEGGAGATQQAGGSSSSSNEPYAPLVTWRTKLTPVYGLRFTTRNLLLGSGALTIPSRK